MESLRDLERDRDPWDQALGFDSSATKGPDPVRFLDARRIFRRPIAVKEDRERAYGDA